MLILNWHIIDIHVSKSSINLEISEKNESCTFPFDWPYFVESLLIRFVKLSLFKLEIYNLILIWTHRRWINISYSVDVRRYMIRRTGYKDYTCLRIMLRLAIWLNETKNTKRKNHSNHRCVIWFNAYIFLCIYMCVVWFASVANSHMRIAYQDYHIIAHTSTHENH